jgi:hypothetical protein
MSTDSKAAGMNMEAGEPGMVTTVIMVGTTGKAYSISGGFHHIPKWDGAFRSVGLNRERR